MSKKSTLPVIVRVENRRPCAFFPTEPGNEGNPSSMGCYSPFDGHGVATEDYVRRKTKPATAEQVSAMLKELERIGYTKDHIIRVVNRMTRAHYEKRRDALR